MPVSTPLDSIPVFAPKARPTGDPVTARSPAAEPANATHSLITNGDFRSWGTDNLPMGWTWNAWCPKSSGAESPPPEAAPEGSGVRLRDGRDRNCWGTLSQWIPITGGRSYRVRARFDPIAKVATHGNSAWTLGFTDHDRSPSGQAGMSLHTGMEVPVPNAGGWVEISLRADPTADIGDVSIRARDGAPDLILREVTCDTITMTDAEALQAVCAELRRRLVVQSVHTVNWDSLQASAIARLDLPGTATDAVLFELLKGTGEPRISVEQGASDVRWITGLRSLNPPPATDGLSSGIGNAIRAQLSDWQPEGPGLATGWTHDNIAYVRATNPIVSQDWLADLADADGLLLDLRRSGTNHGMDELRLEGYQPIAAWLIDAPRVWGYARGAKPHGAPEDTLRVQPAAGAKARMPVVCLMDGSCRDLSAECALMLKGLERVTLVGRPTGGGTGGREKLVVGTGCQVSFPARSLWDLQGRLINDDHGVEPDVFVAPDGSLDPVFAEGLRVLRRKIAAAGD